VRGRVKTKAKEDEEYLETLVVKLLIELTGNGYLE
jgi:hypothetical protein